MIVSLVIIIKSLINLPRNINVGKNKFPCDANFSHIDIYRIKINLIYFLVFGISPLNLLTLCCMWGFQFFKHINICLYFILWILYWYFYWTRQWGRLCNHIHIITIFEIIRGGWNLTLKTQTIQHISYSVIKCFGWLWDFIYWHFMAYTVIIK